MPPLLDKIVLGKPKFELAEHYIHGIEVTQAIQFFQSSEHLNEAEQRPDNSIPLIAYKTACVRVYLRNEWWISTPGSIYFPPGCPEIYDPLGNPPPCAIEIPPVTYLFHGTLTVSRMDQFGLGFDPVFSMTTSTTGLNPLSYRQHRLGGTNVLQFIVPAEVIAGLLRFVVTVRLPNGRIVEVGADLDATLNQSLHVRGIMVAFNQRLQYLGGFRHHPEPTLADLQATAAAALQMLPVQSRGYFGTISAGADTWSGRLKTVHEWELLLLHLQEVVIADGSQPGVLYYGLLNASVPALSTPELGNRPVGGLAKANDIVSVGRAGVGMVMAHELAHLCGLNHAPCGDPGPPVDPWPPYHVNTGNAGTDYISATIGEFGAKIDGIVSMIDPRSTSDFMSYCLDKQWISPKNYLALFHNSKLLPNVLEGWKPGRQIPKPRLVSEMLPTPPNRVISILGILHGEGDLEVTMVARSATHADLRGASPTPMIAELIGKNGEIAARAIVHEYVQLTTCSTCCGEAHRKGPEYPRHVVTFLADAEPGSQLRIREGADVLWTRPSPKRATRIAAFTARISVAKRRSALHLDWQATAEDESTLRTWIQWSNDKGRIWHALTIGAGKPGDPIDASHLPAGAVQIRLLLHDGFTTVESRAGAVEVPKRNPVITVCAPSPKELPVAGQPMLLKAMATGDDLLPVPEEEFTWSLDGKKVGVGSEVVVLAPRVGNHRASVVVAGRGRRSRLEVAFQTVAEVEFRKRNYG